MLERLDAVMRNGLETVYPSAVLYVSQGQNVLFHRAYGFLDPETRQRPTQRESLFDLASVTKLFTVTAFMTLVEAGHVALDTPVADVLPALGGTYPIGPTEDPRTQRPVPTDPTFAGQQVDARQITFWHVLTHTSGLAAWRSIYRENGDERDIPLPHHVSATVRAQRIATIYRYCLAYPPGQRTVYSDLGLILLGETIVRLSGTSLDRYLRRAILEPLGLAHTTYNPLAHQVPPEQIVPTEFCDWRQRRCLGEVHDENAASLGGVAGHAGLFATAQEVATLGQLYLNEGRLHHAQLLSPQIVAEMTRVQTDLTDPPRGLGWGLYSRTGSSAGRHFGPRSYGHTGFTGTSLWVDPDSSLVVALLTNRVYQGRDPTGIADLRPRVHNAIAETLL